MTISVELLLFEGVDLLDVGGPYEVLLTANRLAGRQGLPEVFEVRTVSATQEQLTAYGGLLLGAGDVLDERQSVDVFLVPGTMDIPRATSDSDLMGLITRRAEQAGLVASVCTGSILLAHAGVLGGSPATTHHDDVPDLAGLIGTEAALTARWVDAGSIVTSGGLSSGIAMALHLVERFGSRELAVRTARQMAYDWDPDDGIVTSSSAADSA